MDAAIVLEGQPPGHVCKLHMGTWSPHNLFLIEVLCIQIVQVGSSIWCTGIKRGTSRMLSEILSCLFKWCYFITESAQKLRDTELGTKYFIPPGSEYTVVTIPSVVSIALLQETHEQKAGNFLGTPREQKIFTTKDKPLVLLKLDVS